MPNMISVTRIAVCFVLFIGVDAHTGAVSAQTIATSDLKSFQGKIRCLDKSKQTLDISRFSEWRIGSVSSSSDSNAYWATAAGDQKLERVFSSLADSRTPFYEIRFWLMKVARGFFDVGPAPTLLTVWETVGNDSLTFVGIDTTVSSSIIDSIERVLLFPDGSLLLHASWRSWSDMYADGRDLFFRGVSPCDFRPLMEVRWTTPDTVKSYVLAPWLYYTRYRISVVTEFFTLPDKLGGTLGEINGSYNGSILDSSKVRVVDLWDLAKSKFSIGLNKQ